MKIRRTGRIPADEDLRLYLDERIIPVKFCYPEEGGNRWHELRQDKAYRLGTRELRAFKEGLNSIEEIIGKQPINLVHLGPGDGIEIPILFDKFKPNGSGRYAGVDISEQMIHNTARLNELSFSGVNPFWYLTDIECVGNLELVCADVKKKGAERSLLVVSNEGTLLSNCAVLDYLRDSMNSEDYLFLTLEGDSLNQREEILATYELPETKRLLAVGLKRAGYKAEEGVFKTKFNEAKSRVEVYFKPKDGQEILCLTSYKPKENEFKRRLIDSGFDIQFLQFYEDSHTFAVLCSRGGENV